MKKGIRVGAILGSDGKKVEFLGYGVYEGDFVPAKEINPVLNIGLPNPRIKLDSGKVVWGCECWWGPEDRIKASLDGKTVVNVDIDDARKAYQQAQK